MANSRNVYQQKTTVSIPKEGLLEKVIYRSSLKKKDLKLILFLLTELDGWSAPLNGRYVEDPSNFRHLNCKKIAKNLEMDIKDVEDSLEKFVNLGIIEKGQSKSTRGFRFTF